MNKHRCAATSCARKIDIEYLMCAIHWRMVPQHIQSEIWSQYHRGQRHHTHPTERYLTLAQQAIHCVDEAVIASGAHA